MTDQPRESPEAPIVVSESGVAVQSVDRGDHAFDRRQLGAETVAKDLGCSRYDVPPGKRTWLTHYHTGNEEAVYVLEGSGTLALGPDGEEHALDPGDYAALTADATGTHAVRAGDEGLAVLAFSTMNEPDVTVYPADGKVGLFAGSAPGRSEGRTLSKTLDLHADVPYWDDETDENGNGDDEHTDDGDGLRGVDEAVGSDDGPSTQVVSASDVEWTAHDHGERTFRRRRLGHAAGGRALGCSLHTVEPGNRTWPAHYHTANEEAIYVLDGELTLWVGDERTEHVLEPGDYAALPTGPEFVREVAGRSGDTTGAARYLVVSTMVEPAFTVLPQAGKVHLVAGGAPGNYEGRYVSKTLDWNAEVDYWDAE